MAARLVTLLPRSGARFVGGALKPPTARQDTAESGVADVAPVESSPPRRQSLPAPAATQPPPFLPSTQLPSAYSPLSRFVETVRTNEWRLPRASLCCESLLRGFTSTSVPASPLLARVLRPKDSLRPHEQPAARVDEALLRFEEQCLCFTHTHKQLKGVVDNMRGALAAREGNISEAIARFTLAAEEDSAAADFNLALAHQHGRGLAEDHARALALYERAARRGHAAACLNLAAMLIDASRGADAAQWLARAAELGNTEACVTLALHLLAPTNALSLPCDPPRAVTLLRAAARAGSSEAERYLNICAARGLCDVDSAAAAVAASSCSPSTPAPKSTAAPVLSPRALASIVARTRPARVALADKRLMVAGPADRSRSARRAVRGDHRRAASR